MNEIRKIKRRTEPDGTYSNVMPKNFDDVYNKLDEIVDAINAIQERKEDPKTH